jgi:hypothetical protein
MVKRILHTCLSLNQPIIPLIIAIIAIGFSILLWSLDTKKVQDVGAVVNQSCDIPPSYCDSSIKALEQELKMSHRINDKQTEFMGIDKAELINSLSECERLKSDMIGTLEECGKQINRVSECSRVLQRCNSSLKYCIDSK